MPGSGFKKVRFSSKVHGATAGLVFPVAKLNRMTIHGLSQHFPVSEAMKMRRVEISPAYPTFELAFGHDFDQPKE